MKMTPLLAGIACFALSASAISAADVSGLEAKLQTLVETAKQSGQPGEFIEFRTELRHRTPALTPEEKTLIAHYTDALDAGLAARPVRVLRVKVTLIVERADGPAERGTPMSPPPGLKIGPYVAGLQTAMIAAAKDNGVCELQFRPAFGPKEEAATWKTLKASLIATYQNYVIVTGDKQKAGGVLPHVFRVALLFNDSCEDAPSTWSNPPPQAGASAGDVIVVGEGVPTELNISEFDAYRDKLHEKMLHQLATRIATFPPLKFFPNVDRKSLSLNSILAAYWHDRPMQMSAFLMLEPERFAKEIDAFWENAPVRDFEKIIAPLIQANYTPAAPHIIEHLSALSYQGRLELGKGLTSRPDFADDTLLKAIGTNPNYDICMMAWGYLGTRPKVLDLKTVAPGRIRNFTDPHWKDYLLFYIENLHGSWQEFSDLLFPPTDPKISEQYAAIFVQRSPTQELDAFASENYFQLPPAIVQIFLQRLKQASEYTGRNLEAARMLLEKGDARTPEDNVHLQHLAEKYSTVHKAM